METHTRDFFSIKEGLCLDVLMFGKEEHRHLLIHEHILLEICQLPNEIVENILKCADGITFIHLRCTCKRFKNIADNMEIKMQPSVWYIFALQDFPLFAIESLIPWMTLEKSHDMITWKTVYMTLIQSRKERNMMKIQSMPTKGHGIALATDIKFIGTHLCVLDHLHRVCVLGLCKKQEAHQIVPIKDCQHQDASLCLNGFIDVFTREKLQPLLKEFVVRPLNIRNQNKEGVAFFRRRILDACHGNSLGRFMKGGYWMHQSLVLLNSNEISVKCCDHHGDIQNNKILSIANIHKIAMADVISDKVIIACKDKLLQLLVCDDCFPEKDPEIFKVCLPDIPICFQLLGESIIFLFENDGVVTAKLKIDVSSINEPVTIGPWKELCLIQSDVERGNEHVDVDNIVDFSHQGLCLVVATKSGKIFVGHHQDWNNWQFFRPFKINLHDSGSVTRVTLDVNSGLTVAVLETFYDGLSWTSAIHLLFLT